VVEHLEPGTCLGDFDPQPVRLRQFGDSSILTNVNVFDDANHINHIVIDCAAKGKLLNKSLFSREPEKGRVLLQKKMRIQ
jgi:hypothetical protein